MGDCLAEDALDDLAAGDWAIERRQAKDERAIMGDGHRLADTKQRLKSFLLSRHRPWATGRQWAIGRGRTRLSWPLHRLTFPALGRALFGRSG
jgi:hypothetical protein